MKKYKVIFWASTIPFAAFMLYSGYNYLTAPGMKAAFEFIGFPDYFRVELGWAKILGSIALLVPFVPAFIKYFAYSGFAINVISAAIAHLSIGDAFSSVTMPFICLVAILVSVYSYVKLNSESKDVIA